MTTFAQALARIEELLEDERLMEVEILLGEHATSIVQLGKAAAEIHAILEHARELRYLGGGSTSNWASQACQNYNKLMKGE